MDNITFDLETLGNSANAPIIQIGAVKFKDDGTIIDEFKRNIDLNSLKGLGFIIDYNTLEWWFNQSHEAISSVFNNDNLNRVSLNLALYEFQKWIGKTADYIYWSHATFDPPILVNNYKALKKGCPIPFRLHNDIRTLTTLVKKQGKVINVERVGIHHDALDDCIYQAAYISRGLQLLK